MDTESIKQIKTIAELEEIRVKHLGKNGSLTLQMKELGKLSPEERKTKGAELNKQKEALQEAIDARKSVLELEEMNKALAAGKIDVTLPVLTRPQGRVHPITQVMDEMIQILGGMGFALKEGPDVETDWYCFEALNFPKDHPARDMQDTFFLEGSDTVLRTHTSAVQIRTMEKEKPPIKIISPGRTYRVDSDATHAPMFHQIEGLWIDKGIHMGHLKGVLLDLLKAFFESDDVKLKFRPSFFPFTEPSAEVDINYTSKDGELIVGVGDKWMEILGCGMVHPNVLKNCGIDPAVYQGFAFGMGIDRMAMLKYGIPDLRLFCESDVRWLKHYGFTPFDIPSLVGGLSGTGGLKL